MAVRLTEILAPAKDVDVAMSAILAGADSVYIGAPEFGARAAAGNSVDEIQKLCKFAHIYNCAVYITINTILTDVEIDRACELIEQLYNVGVDAIIVQDMGLVQKCRCKIPFHASTQCHLSTPEKAQFLSACGFDTLVLARELSVDEIKSISASVPNRLECFVHGALCVSYSGQCYLSYAIGGRSGNRGVCAQPCRMKWSVLDADGKSIFADAYFLSLRDMNRSKSLQDMLEAGVSVFKIEGRLKSQEYVKNVVAHYRQSIDKIIDANSQKYARLSFGKTKISFTPSPAKTFSRAFTEYHLHGISSGNESFSTPKARGEFLGKIKKVFVGGFFFDNAENIFSNGDGIFLDGKKQIGCNIRKIEGNKVFIGMPTDNLTPSENSEIWRNKDLKFEKQLQQKIERKLPIVISISETQSQWIFSAKLCDERKTSAEIIVEKHQCDVSENLQMATERISQNLAKLGGTPFEAEVEVIANSLPMLKTSETNALRRNLVEKLSENILTQYELKRISHQRKQPTKQAFDKLPFSADKYANIFNNASKMFYKEMGFDIDEFAPETSNALQGLRVMTTRHCILREKNLCKKQGKFKGVSEPLYLQNSDARLRLQFDCTRCGMDIFWE